jgi:AAHS family 4-hydroxybenzoate transporter-like MFS transporter
MKRPILGKITGRIWSKNSVEITVGANNVASGSGSTINVSDLVDGAKLRGLIAYAPLLCGLLMVVEGLDTYGIGYVGPMMSEEFKIDPRMLGVIYAGTVAASLIGAVVFAPLADRIGSRNILVASSFTMALGTFATPFASDPIMLFIARFLIGVAFGAALPCAFALTAGYAPARLRSRVLMIVMAGIGVGVVIAGIASAYIIPAFGWKAQLWAYGIVTLIIAVVIAISLPESLRFAVLRQPDRPSTRRLVARVLREQGIPDQDNVKLVSDEKPLGRPGLELMRHGRVPLTIALVSAVTCAYAVQFFNSSWLPTILLGTGVSVTVAGLVTACAKVGSITGDFVLAWAMDRFGAWPMLVVGFVGGVVSVIGLGLAAGVPAAAFVLLIACLFFIDGVFGGVLVVISSSYPVAMRSTASGWLVGIGRLVGGSIGSLSGGFVVAAHWATWQTALLLAGPLALAAVVLIVGIRMRLPERAAADRG